MIPWDAILDELRKNPEFLRCLDPRQMEEFVAASYDVAGFEEVTLTPRSGDRGRDVIAVKRGLFKIRVLDQVKALNKTIVTPDDVRAMIGTLALDSAASKAVITTTSEFAPSVITDPDIKRLMPSRLELRNRAGMLEWLKLIDDTSGKKSTRIPP